jgi:hypothetical protein
MTALAIDMRELSAVEVDHVSGGENLITWDDVRAAFGEAVVRCAIRLALTPVGALTIGFWLLSATPAE